MQSKRSDAYETNGNAGQPSGHPPANTDLKKLDIDPSKLDPKAVDQEYRM